MGLETKLPATRCRSHVGFPSIAQSISEASRIIPGRGPWMDGWTGALNLALECDGCYLLQYITGDISRPNMIMHVYTPCFPLVREISEWCMGCLEAFSTRSHPRAIVNPKHANLIFEQKMVPQPVPESFHTYYAKIPVIKNI